MSTNDERTIGHLIALLQDMICERGLGLHDHEVEPIARAALAVVRREDGWQPIATAPKAWESLGNGSAVSRRILLGNDHGSLFIGFWSDPNGGPGWWKDTSTNQPVFSAPTRWRPLPETSPHKEIDP